MPNIKPISILREKKILDKISQEKEPVFITKNGSSYLVLQSQESYDKILAERDFYRDALAREKEIRGLVNIVNSSNKDIADGKYYSEKEFDQLLEKL